jgi:transposase
MLERVIEPMLHVCEALRTEFHTLHRAMLDIVRHDGVCRRLMTVPGVGALVGGHLHLGHRRSGPF